MSEQVQVAPTLEPLAPVDDRLEEALGALKRRQRRRARTDLVLGVGTPIMLLGLWQLAAHLNWVDPRIFTPPSSIAVAAGQLISAGTLQADLAATLARLLVGYAIGAAGGVAVGLVLGLVRPLRAAFSPLFTALYAVPQIALLPLLLVIFGVGETPKVLTVVAVTFFVLEINTLAAVRNFDPRLIEAGRAYGATGAKLFRHVLFPGTLPQVFTGLRVSIALGLVVITATEFVASNNGLGFLVWNSWQLFQPDQMYVGLVTIALLGVVLTAIISILERLALPWLRRRHR
ncbi:MAG: ABC transporter permease [Actinomycetota bacterium]|nr:ABC transporter permease [Actinomycetota bacterium]